MAKVDAVQKFARGRRVLEFGSGSVKQRDVDAALREVGGRGSKGAQAARDYGQLARIEGEKAVQGLHGPRTNAARSRVNRAFTQVEGAVKSPRSVSTLLKAGLRGMLSPAGLAEGVAGNVAKLSDEAGRESMHEAMESGRKIKMPRSKPTRSKA